MGFSYFQSGNNKLLIKAAGMQTNASNQFTFKAVSSQFQSIRNSKEFNPTIHQSLPKRQRKHKIFQGTRLFDNQRYNSTNKKNRSPIFEKRQGKNASILQEPYYKIPDRVDTPQEKKEEVAFSSAYKEMIEKKLASKGTALLEYPKEKLFEELSKKQREIRVLKLEIERSKRCETLTKANEDLYKRLIVRLKQTKEKPIIRMQQSFNHQPIQEEQRTPIHSLTDIRFTPKMETPKSSPKKEENIIINNKITNTVPLMTIPEQREQTHMATQNTETHHPHRAQSHNKTYHSPLKAHFYQTDPVFLKLQEEMNVSRSRFKTSIKDLPVNQRLTAINRALQSSFTEYSRRASHRHSSQRKQRQGSAAKGNQRHR